MNRIEELLEGLRARTATPEDLAELKQRLATPEGRAKARECLWMESALHSAFRAAPVLAALAKMAPPQTMAGTVVAWVSAPSRQSWARWAIAAGIMILGTVGWWQWQPSCFASATLSFEASSGAGESILITRAGRTWSPAGPVSIGTGDTIELADNGVQGVELQLDGAKTAITLQPGAKFRVVSLAPQKRFALDRGSLRAEVAHQPEGKPMLIQTAQAEALVLGTVFTLSAGSQQTGLAVEQGVVRLSQSDGRAENVKADQTAVASSGVPLHVTSLASLDAAPLREAQTSATQAGTRDAADDMIALQVEIAKAQTGKDAVLRRTANAAEAWLNTAGLAGEDPEAIGAKGDRYLARLRKPGADAEPIADRDLRGHWSFSGRKSFTRVYDESGRENTGTLINMASSVQDGSAFTTGKIGDGIRLKRAKLQHILCGPDASLNTPTAITVAAWVKPTSSLVANQIVSCHDANSVCHYRLNINKWGQLDLWVRTGTQGMHLGGMGAARRTWSNAWHHVAWTYDSASSTTKFYVDGVQDFSSTTISTGAMNSTAVTFKIGGHEMGTYFDGDMDDVRLYDRALSQAEILAVSLE